MIFLVQLAGINSFWIKSDKSEKEIIYMIRDFEYQRGIFGFKKLNRKQKYALVNEFCEKLNFTIQYYTILDRELKIRERSAAWLCRKIEENLQIKLNERMVARYARGTSIPIKENKNIIEKYLGFKWC